MVNIETYFPTVEVTFSVTMLHACHLEKSRSTSTPDEICSDFRRALRERASNHSQYYRHLAGTPVINTLTEQCTRDHCHQASASNITQESCLNGNPNLPKTWPSRPQPAAITDSPANYLTPSESTPRPSADKAIVNHQPTILNVDKIEFNDRYKGKQIDSADTVVTSMVPTDSAGKHSQQTVVSISVDSSNDSDAPTFAQPSADSPCSQLIASPDDNNPVNVGVGNDIISVSALAGGAQNHCADKKSSVSALPSSVVIAPAINNNNKTCEQHDRNHSNYSTFVRTTSLSSFGTTNQESDSHLYACPGVSRDVVQGNEDSDGCSTPVPADPISQEEELLFTSFLPNSNSDVSSCNPRIKNKYSNFEKGLGGDDFRNSGPSANETFQADVSSSGLIFRHYRKSANAADTGEQDLVGDGEQGIGCVAHSVLGVKPNDASDKCPAVAITDDLRIVSAVNSSTVRPTDLSKDINLHTLAIGPSEGQSQNIQQYYNFPCVEKLVKMYTKLLQDKKSETKSSDVTGDDKSKAILSGGEVSEDCDMKSMEGLRIKDVRITDMSRGSPISDEGCALASSPYSSDIEENENDPSVVEQTEGKEKVLRSSSSDSALDLDDEPPMEPPPNMNTGRRMTLTVTDIPLRAALLPVPEPHSLPDSTVPIEPAPATPAIQTAVPSKVILEERLVEIPEDKFPSASNSRRESALTSLSDFDPIECGAVRFVRTPSVVVSDYSDDILCGVTLEEIEYFRAHRMRRRSSADTNHTEKDDAASDVSAASSCSNLDYCGSTISGLDGTEYYVNGERMSIDRKVSDCSTCSTMSGDDDEDRGYIPNQDYAGEEQQQKEDMLQRERRKKIQVKARHPKFIN
ncbi:unnamed protein product [Hermetia illucens]|uniref:Uncharacterized protein n=1 Tax=Hermetia illucens TaxID=343691 RepID=A0A7R8YZF1_HERIL|nr:unnamed protein product [Hermetia illucens]